MNDSERYLLQEVLTAQGLQLAEQLGLDEQALEEVVHGFIAENDADGATAVALQLPEGATAISFQTLIDLAHHDNRVQAEAKMYELEGGGFPFGRQVVFGVKAPGPNGNVNVMIFDNRGIGKK